MSSISILHRFGYSVDITSIQIVRGDITYAALVDIIEDKSIAGSSADILITH